MCSACSGDYENPEMTQPDDRESSEQEVAAAIEQEQDGPDVSAEEWADNSGACCPDCERPNQFGDLCASCLRERDQDDDCMDCGVCDACIAQSIAYAEQMEQEREQEQILEASRSVRAGTDLLFSALRKAGCL